MLFPWLDPVGRVQADHMTFRGEHKVESMSVNDIVLIKQLKKLERNMTGTDILPTKKLGMRLRTMHMHVHGLYYKATVYVHACTWTVLCYRVCRTLTR